MKGGQSHSAVINTSVCFSHMASQSLWNVTSLSLQTNIFILNLIYKSQALFPHCFMYVKYEFLFLFFAYVVVNTSDFKSSFIEQLFALIFFSLWIF